ncbi:MAG: hypothetical protein HZC01_02660 [Candidatus Kerfeldbacteria bacterium]|nr:hypothetical protein [Candidatus Kerfeldbacteria bacterium]
MKHKVIAAVFSSQTTTNLNRVATLVTLIAMLGVILVYPGTQVKAVGIDAVTASVPEGSDATGAAAAVTVTFESSVLSNGEVFTIYLGEDTTGDEWGLNAVATGDISCSDNGTGETYTVGSVNAASATLPMRTAITATTVGTGATTTTCVIGDGTPNPTNPTVADGYSVAVVTSADSGAGIIYIGDANDVTVSVNVLPNLTLTIDNADGTNCTTSSGVTSCNLGTVLTTTVGQGNYDVNVGTNATSGATLQIAEDGNLRNGANEIADATENDTIVAGTTDYGIAVASDGGWTEQGNFNDDDTPIPTGPATVATTAGAVAYTNDVTVTHKVAVDSTVPALVYSHIVTWTATANF